MSKLTFSCTGHKCVMSCVSFVHDGIEVGIRFNAILPPFFPFGDKYWLLLVKLLQQFAPSCGIEAIRFNLMRCVTRNVCKDPPKTFFLSFLYLTPRPQVADHDPVLFLKYVFVAARRLTLTGECQSDCQSSKRPHSRVHAYNFYCADRRSRK